jgi:hypothetical protein
MTFGLHNSFIQKKTNHTKAPNYIFRTKYLKRSPLKAAIDLPARPCPGELRSRKIVNF